MDTLTKLISLYNNKSETAYHNLVEQMLAHLAAIPHMSIYELAEVCYTSTTAVSRFVRRLEYENFHQFKNTLATTLNYYPQANRRMPLPAAAPAGGLAEHYTQLLCDRLQRFTRQIPAGALGALVDALAAAKRIVFVSPAPYNFEAMQYDLAIRGKTTVFSDNLTDSLADIKGAGPDCFVLFFISSERESNRMEGLLRAAGATGAALGVMARDRFLPPDKYAPLRVSYESCETNMDDALFAHLMNLLILHFRHRYVDKG